MAGVDAFEIGQKGVTLEAFAPSEKLSDSQMDAVNVSPFMVSVGKTFSLGNYLTVNQTGVIDTIASIMQETGKAVMVWFYFTEEEWESNKKDNYTVPEVRTALQGPGDARSLRHSVAAIDHFLYKGKKALWVEDSAHFANVPNRIITEDFFRARNWFIGHFMNFAFESAAPTDPRPTHLFLRDLEFSPIVNYDADVTALQDILKYEGLFPSNIESTGYFGSITKDSVLKFQLKYGVVASANSAGAGRVGPLTRAKLNELYS